MTQTKEIRIVGVSNSISKIWVQTRINGKWFQKTMNHEDFEKMMINDFPKYWEEYKATGRTDTLDYFYSYGEGESKDTYIFRS